MKTIISILFLTCAAFAAKPIELPHYAKCTDGAFKTFTPSGLSLELPNGVRVKSSEGCSVLFCFSTVPDSLTISSQGVPKKIANPVKQKCAKMYPGSVTQGVINGIEYSLNPANLVEAVDNVYPQAD